MLNCLVTLKGLHCTYIPNHIFPQELYDRGKSKLFTYCYLKVVNYFPISNKLNCTRANRGAPDARIITVTSSWYRKGSIHWDDVNFQQKRYSACDAHNQSRLANVLFTRELARRLDGTGVNR